MTETISNVDFPQILETLNQAIAGPEFTRFVISIVVIGAFVLINRVLIRAINNRVEDANRRHIYRKIVNYSSTAVILIALLFTWVRNLAFLTAAIGFIAAGLAIALRDVIMSLFGWIKILWVHPFGVGDRIEINQIEGDIIDISPLHTVLLELGNWVNASQSTGRIVYIPNHLIFQRPVYNSTLGFNYLWDEFSILVTFESDYQRAEELMKEPVQEEIGINYRRAREEIQKLGNKYAIQYENLNPRVYTKVADSGVQLTLRYLTRSRGRREINSRLSQKILSLLQESPRVELAYPTYRIFRRDIEEEADESDPPPHKHHPGTNPQS